MKRFVCLSILLSFVLASVVMAGHPNLGTSGAKFLQIPVGARAMGMGGAIVGLADDASSAFWNPAGLVHVQNTAAHFSYLRWFGSFDLNAISVVQNFGDFGTLSVNMISLAMDRMEITTETSPNGTGLYFDAQDLAFGLSYSRFLTTDFSVGVTAKYVYQRIWNETAEGIAFDVGTQYRLAFNNLTIAMSMNNFGSDLQFDGPDMNINYARNENFPISRLAPARLETEAYPLPLHFQVGLGMDLYQSEFIKARGAIDAAHPSDNNERINVGGEIGFFDRLFVRGGYRFNYDDESLALGGGVRIPFAGSDVLFDYALTVYDILPDVHRISVGLLF
jgi:hypothetical protein